MTIDYLSQDLCWLLDESNDHNILIYAGEVPNTKTFKAHINILRARSLYFRAVLSSKLLSSNFKKDPNNSFITEWYQPNISPETFEVLLRYIYSGSLNIDESNIEKTLDYLIAADILWLHQLLEFLQTYLIKNHSAWIKANFVKVYHLMHLHPTTFKKLQQFCKVILSTDSKILFDSPHFTSFTEEAFISLLKKDYLKVDESFLWSKIIEWGIAQNQQLLNPDVSSWSVNDFSYLRITLSKFLPLVKFEDMYFEDFIEKVRPYKVLFP
ncbi:27534_t:CDS:2 [Dentiscutata erythropus]|uniref:27534_t:CDS:1 n=1 Tax=Dentiscutata erythropus TaxID=1348616 RepID=A0A9N9IP42_9GLOM|nr:27534_t:CDS:2 [Dentiscutata erythropus]